MSQENVEVIRRQIEAFNREDWDAAFKETAPEAEFDLSRAVGLDRGVYTLRQARRLVEEFYKVWESIRIEADEFIDAGEHVVMPFTNRQRGRDGIELQSRGTWLCTIRDGLIVRICLYQAREEALEAAGLWE